MKIILNFSLILLCTNVYGFRYPVDKLYYNNDTLKIYRLPLDSTFQKFIKAESINYSDCASMKCTDGRRVWELRNDSLFLKKILNCCGDELLNKNLNSFLIEGYDNNEIFASWISRNIYNPYGKLIKYISDYYIYEFDRDFEIVEGKLKAIHDYDNSASRESIYCKEINVLNQYLYKSINWELIKKCECDLDKIIIINFKVNLEAKPEGVKVLRGVGEVCNAEIIRVIREISGWDLYLKRGKPIEMSWNLPIRLNKLIQLKENIEK